MEKMKKIPERYQGLLTLAKTAPDNIQSFAGDYDITPVDHDYAGQFQKKANHVFKRLGLSLGFALMVGDPTRGEEIYDAFRQDPHYLGGGTGSGFKNKAPQWLDELDPLAKQIGAINVVTKQEGRLRGYNTDGSGFAQGLEDYLSGKFGKQPLVGRQVLIIGAGGTADAIAFTLAGRQVKLTILNRTTEKAEKLAQGVLEAYPGAAFGGSEDLLPKYLPQADVVINASTKGAEGPFEDFVALAPAKPAQLAENLEASRQAVKLLKPEAVVCDINLRASESPTLRLAREYGHPVQDGRPMNFFQAVEALWLIHQNLFKEKGINKEELGRLIKEAE